MAKEIHQSIVIDAKIKTTLENMDKSVKDLQDGLKKGITSLDMSKGLGNSLSKTLSAFQDEFKNFSDLTKSGKLEFMDSKAAIRSGEKIIEKYREIQRVVGNLSDLQIADAKKLFPDAFKSDVDDLSNKLNSLKQTLGNLEVKGLEVTQAETKLNALNTQINELKGKLIDEKPLEVSVEDANKKLKTAQEEVEKIRNALKEELRLKLEAADSKVVSVKGQIESIEKTRAARNTSKLAVGERGQITYEGKTSAQWKQSGASKEQIAAAQTAIQTYAAEERQLTSLRNALKDITGDANKLREAFTGFGEKTDLTKTAAMLGQSAGQIEQTKNALDNQAQAAENVAQAQDKLNQAQNENKATNKSIVQTTKDIAEQEQKVAKLQAQYTQLFGKIDVSKLEQGLQKTLGQDFTPQMLQNKDGIEQLLTKLRETDQVDLEKLKASLIQLGVNADTAEDYVRQLREGLGGIREASADISKASQEMDMLKNRVLYFFSMTNSVQLFKRAVTSALNTVKELDKTMTEAAVVTEFDVSDMWDKLPQYAKHAQELGVSINGMYQATTLYYQQGLKTNEAMALGIETMKMGKIASMDSTEATKAMTAALRGFNMELNETSATRVNDVYSQLAAVTAADTNQIATAMEKTASIAAAANMEFESTAAFLAQIIETTQEAPETAGTALKTIIARFSEVKSLREQGLASGKDSEGEGIDVNKIQTALKTVGISMEGFFAGTEGLDSILMKLAEKWGTLDFETQRYIATMAAGSRQQSRFIAMMSDYKRTAELVSEAQNSAGASTRQFEKTLESMESKLQRLENAWNEFLMGLANNEILKGAVDLVTSLVTGINNLTNSLSGGNGLLKSFVSLMVTLGGLSMGKAALSGGLGWVGRQMGIKGAEPQSEKTSFADRKTQWDAQRGGRKVLGFMSSKEITERAQDRAEKFGINKAIKENKKILKNSSNAKDFSQKLQNSTTNTEKNTAAMAAANKTYEETFKNQKDVKVAAAEATKEFERQGGTLVNAKQEQEILSKSTKKLGVDYKALGGAVMGAGAAFGGLAVLLSAVGLDEAAEEVGKISGILMGLGAIISFLGPAVQGLAGKIAAAGITAGAAWAWTIGIVVVIAAIVAIVIALGESAKSAAEEMAELESQTKALAEAADKAEESMQKLADTQKDLANLKNTMDGLIKGTDEWNKALIESNNKVLELLDTYPELTKYVHANENNLLEIDAKGWALITQKQMEAYANASTAKLALQTQKTVVAKRIVNQDETLSDSERAARETALDIQGKLQMEEFYRQVAASNAGLKGDEFSEYSATALAAEGLADFTEQLSKATKEIEINEQAYQEYADIIGITLEEAKKADKVAVKNTLAASRVQKASADRMKKINTNLSGLKGPDLDLAKALLSKDGSEITGTQATELSSNLEKFKTVLGLTGTEFEGLKFVVSQVNDFFIDLGSTIELLGLKGTSLEALLQNSNYQTASGITSKIASLEGKGASSEAIKGWFDQLLLGKNEEQKNTILETMAITDWNSIEDLNSTFDSFVEKGILDSSFANDLNLSMRELAKAVSDNTFAQLQDKGYKLQDLIEMIKTGEIDQNQLTTDQKELIKTTTGATENDFVSIGTDKWQYKGDLYSKVVNLYSDNLKNQNEKTAEARENYDTAKKYKEKGFSKKVADINNLNYAPNRKLTEEEVIQVGLGGQIPGMSTEDASNIMTSYAGWQSQGGQTGTGMTLTEFVESMGFGSSLSVGEDETVLVQKAEKINALYKEMAEALDEVYDENASPEVQLAKIQEWEEKWKNTEEYKKLYEQSILNDANLVQTNIGATTVEIGWEKFDNHQDQQKYNETRSEALDQRLRSTGGTIFIDKISKEFEAAGKKAEDFADIIKALASDIGVVANKTQTLANNMGNLSEGLGKDKNSIEYGRALEQAKTNVADYFSISLEKLDMANISEELYTQLAKGDPNALKQISSNIAQALITGGKSIEEFLAGLSISPEMDENSIKNLYIALGGAEEDFNKDMEGALSFIANRLTMLGKSFTYQISVNGALTGSVADVNITDFYVPNNGGGGGGSSSKWENPYDELYNTVAKINEELRKREQLERQYQRLLDRSTATARQLADLAHSQIASLEIELADRKKVLEGRERQMDEIQNEYSDVSKYAYYDKDAGQVVINWDLLESLEGSEDEELTSRIEEFISKLEDQEGLIEEEIAAIDEIEDAVWEIEQQGKDEYLDLETQIKEAIIAGRQAEIDKLSEINETITNSDAEIIESMQKSIEKQRQDRENQEAEDELAKKQRRLLYLQQDTSGANAMEILKLQDEIEKGQQDYTDRLIDQKISELQEQNDAAAKQRDQQIKIAQAQLDQYADSEEIWTEVQKLMAEGLSPTDGLLRGSKLAEILKDDANFEGLSKIGKLEWWKEMDKKISQALQYFELGRQLENVGVEAGTKVEFFDIETGHTLSGTVDEEGNVVLDDGTVYDNVFEGADGKYYAGKNQKKPDVEENNKNDNGENKKEGEQVPSGYWSQEKWTTVYQGKTYSSEKSEEDLRNQVREEHYQGGLMSWFDEQYEVKYWPKKWIPYKTGGLADFTGPAWLDGTKARPEIVLDAQDSRNFIQLRDILGSLLNRSTTNTSTENNGDITYDIDINVEKIDNDYDLEQVANKVESLITDKARYRNNNAVGLKR